MAWTLNFKGRPSNCEECSQRLCEWSCHIGFHPDVVGSAHSHTISLDRSWYRMQRCNPEGRAGHVSPEGYLWLPDG